MIKPERAWPALFLLQFARGIAVVDLFIIPVALPAIIKAFGLQPLTAIWVINIYQLSNTITLLLCGSLAKLFGERNVINLGSLVFALGCVICGFSEEVFMLLLGRAVMGVGGGLVQPLGSAIITETFSREKIAWIYPATRLFFIVLVLFAPLIAGVVIHFLNWHYIFWINIPLGLLCFLGCHLWINNVKKEAFTFPYASALFSLLGGGLLILTIMHGRSFGWGSWQTAAGFLLSALFIFLYIYQSLRDKVPLVPLNFFRYRLFLLLVFQLFFFSMAGALLTFWIIFYGTYLNHPAISVGLFFFYCQLPAVLVSLLSSLALKKFRHRTVSLALYGIWLLGILWTWMTFGVGQLLYLYMGVTCVAATLSTIASTGSMWIMRHVPSDEMGDALSIISTSGRYGSTIGLAILTALFQTAMHESNNSFTFAFALINATGFFLSIVGLILILAIRKRDEEAFSKHTT